MDSVYIKNALPYRQVENLSLLHLGERRIFFNETGTAIWSLLDGKRTNEEVACAVFSRNGSQGSLAKVTASVNQFVDTLQKIRLVRQHGEQDNRQAVNQSAPASSVSAQATHR